MATENKNAAEAAAKAAEAEAAAKAAEAAPKTVRLRAVYGDIVHAFNGHVFTQDAEHKHIEDAWVKVQVEAGKLVVVTD